VTKSSSLWWLKTVSVMNDSRLLKASSRAADAAEEAS
jgi:hypothetical protein